MNLLCKNQAVVIIVMVVVVITAEAAEVVVVVVSRSFTLIVVVTVVRFVACSGSCSGTSSFILVTIVNHQNNSEYEKIKVLYTHRKFDKLIS